MIHDHFKMGRRWSSSNSNLVVRVCRGEYQTNDQVDEKAHQIIRRGSPVCQRDLYDNIINNAYVNKTEKDHTRFMSQ